jgi:hypothetical protein
MAAPDSLITSDVLPALTTSGALTSLIKSEPSTAPRIA